MKFACFVTLLTLFSCSAHVRQKASERPANAPANYEQVGEVSYLGTGAGWIVKSRRESAFEQMSEDCGGSYEIIKEGFTESGAMINPNGFGGANISTVGNIHIFYKCIPATAEK